MGDEKQIRLLEDKVNTIIMREKILLEEYQKIAIELKELRARTVTEEENVQEEIIPNLEAGEAKETEKEKAESTFITDSIAAARKVNQAGVQKVNQTGVENIFGKNIMGVVACILIFIGLISLASLIYGRLSDGVKMAAMFLLSGGFLAAGLFLGRETKNTFSKLLLGCGVGGMYISIVATRLVFQFSTNITMYGLLLFWIIGVLYLTNRYGHSNVFRLICQIGVGFSVFLGKLTEVTMLEAALLTVFAVVTFTIIEISKKVTDFITNIGYLVMTATFMMLIVNTYWSNIWITMLNLTVFIVFYVVVFQKIRRHQEMIPALQAVTAAMMTIGLLLALPFGLRYFNDENTLLASGIYIGIIVAVNLPVLLGKYKKEIELSVLFPSLLTLIFLVPLVIYDEFDIPFTGYLFMYIPLLISGFRRKYLGHQVAGFVLLGWEIIGMIIGCVFWDNSLPLIRGINIFTILVMTITLFAIIQWLYRKREIYGNIAYRVVIYMMLNLMAIISMELLEVPNGDYVSLVLCVVLNILAVYSGLFYKWDETFVWFTDDYERYHQDNIKSLCFLMILGSVLYLNLIVQIRLNEAPMVFFVIFVLLALALSLMKCRELYQYYRKSSWIGPLLGLKLTLLIYAVTSISEAATKYSYIISILFIIFSCGCIYFGFYKRIVSLRVYGLVLAILAVLKLVTYDISDLNSIIRVIAFILGGILCFVISLLYNNANKKIED